MTLDRVDLDRKGMYARGNVAYGVKRWYNQHLRNIKRNYPTGTLSALNNATADGTSSCVHAFTELARNRLPPSSRFVCGV